MYYFAYGSNMNHEQMRERCPTSKFITKVFLTGYKFVYDGYSKTWNGPVANIKASPDDVAWGVLFEINQEDLAALDCYEGYPKVYDREEVEVKDEEGKIHKAVTYLRINKNPAKPTQDYLKIVLQGAKDWELPEEYINGVLKC